MTETYATKFSTAFTPNTLMETLPLRLVRHGFQENLACSLDCAAQLLDLSIEAQGPGVAIELADPLATHDKLCGQCHRRVS